MPKRWTKQEERERFKELHELYIVQNKTISEIAAILKISEKTVFKRFGRLNIKTVPHKKLKFLNKRQDLKIPENKSGELAEFIGIMLGDGHISHFQTTVTLGNKEIAYVEYIVGLMQKIFRSKPKVSIKRAGYRTIYLGSVSLTAWLFQMGLVTNKVRSQVDIPKWIFTNREFMKKFLRGFFDTDGSVYKLRHGIQISLTNRSLPLLKSLHNALTELQYKPSAISCYKIYITNRKEVTRFFEEIKPQNNKHLGRFKIFSIRADTEVAKRGRL